jgi:uncharacterized protein
LTLINHLSKLNLIVPTNEFVPVEPLLNNEAPPFAPLQESRVADNLSPDNPPWSLFQGFLVWGSSVALLLFVPFVLVLPYVVYKVVSSGSSEALANDPNLIFLSIVGVLPTHILTFLLVWLVVTNRGRRPFWPLLGWTWPRGFGPLKTFGIAVILLGIGWTITHFFGGAETQLDEIIKSSPQARIVVAFLAAVTGPLVEELVYRGVLYSAVQRVLGVAWAVGLVSVLFAAVHVAQYYNNFGVILAISVLSVSLTLIRARTGSLLPSYVIHFVFNGIQAVLLLLQPWLEKNQDLQKTIPGILFTSINRFFS